MNRRYLPTYAAAAFCAAFAAGRAGAQTPATSGRNSGKEYALKNVSTFTPPAVDSRNPFWPIGWVPTAPVPVANQTVAPVVDVRADQFTVTSISMDSAGALAVINGQVKAVGERLLVSGGVAGTQIFVTVKKIADGKVTLDYKGHELLIAPTIPGPVKK